MKDQAMNYMVKPAGKATFQDILDAPDDVKAEVINGELYLHPRAAPRHQRFSFLLGNALEAVLHDEKSGHSNWIFIPDTNVHLSPHDICGPDIAGWRVETMPHVPETAQISVRPDWVCEIISPSSERLDRHDKFAMYARFGIPHYWIVDHRNRLVEAYQLEEGRWVTIGVGSNADAVSFAPFDHVTLELGRLWPDQSSLT